jgi:hypothetical protein
MAHAILIITPGNIKPSGHVSSLHDVQFRRFAAGQVPGASICILEP